MKCIKIKQPTNYLKIHTCNKMSVRMSAADFMLMDIQQEYQRFINKIGIKRLGWFLKGEYELEEGEMLPGLIYSVDETVTAGKIGTKHTWTEFETSITVLGYLNDVDYKQLGKRLPGIPLNSIKMKYQNCLYLEKGNIKGALSNCSKLHREVWVAVKRELGDINLDI